VGGRNGRPLILRRIRAVLRAFGARFSPRQNEVRSCAILKFCLGLVFALQYKKNFCYNDFALNCFDCLF